MNLKQRLSRKLKKTGGFTLIEMLIVVAIIAILVAVSIPMVNSSLGKARKATDDANERAAKAAAIVEYMINGTGSGANKYCYNEDGTVLDADTAPSADGYSYGQGGYTGAPANCEGGYVIVEFAADGSVKTYWAQP